MKAINIIFFVLALVLTSVSCSEKSEKSKISAKDEPVTNPVTPSQSTQTTPFKSTNPEVTIGTQAPAGTQTPVNKVTPPPSTNQSGQKLNPPHGQPGHDCKVAVGSPLPAGGSTSTNATQFQTTPAGPRVNTPPSTGARVTQQTPAGMNPPHGQPGHDCKIAVGAPLNSGTK